MKTFTYTITDPVGIHARPAGNLVAEVKKYASNVTITNKAGKSAAAGKLIQLMGLGIRQGDEITVSVEGTDEDTAASALEKFFKENL